MGYEDRLQALIDKGALTPQQARQFSESLERLTPAGATLAGRKPVSMLKVSLSLLSLLVAGTVAISLFAHNDSTATETIQNVANTMNQPGATGNLGESVTTLLSLFLLCSIPVAGVMFFIAGLYNRLIGFDEETKKTGAYIHNALQNKTDLLPKLETVAQSALRYEETLQHSVAETRSSAAHKLQDALEEAHKTPETPLSNVLNATMEAYPDLKGQESIQHLLSELSRLEHSLLIARNIHAEAIAELNTASRGVFGGIVASMYGFRPHYQAS